MCSSLLFAAVAVLLCCALPLPLLGTFVIGSTRWKLRAVVYDVVARRCWCWCNMQMGAGALPGCTFIIVGGTSNSGADLLYMVGLVHFYLLPFLYRVSILVNVHDCEEAILWRSFGSLAIAVALPHSFSLFHWSWHFYRQFKYSDETVRLFKAAFVAVSVFTVATTKQSSFRCRRAGPDWPGVVKKEIARSLFWHRHFSHFFARFPFSTARCRICICIFLSSPGSLFFCTCWFRYMVPTDYILHFCYRFSCCRMRKRITGTRAEAGGGSWRSSGVLVVMWLNINWAEFFIRQGGPASC